MCCQTNGVYECTSANGNCNTGIVGSNLVLKMIANLNAFSFLTTNDDPSSSEGVYKGVEILPGWTPERSYFGTELLNICYMGAT